jgi:predicted nuclease of predicted toxin-antitoxin system
VSFLFDENLSPTLCEHLADLWPEAVHVHLVGLGSSSDQTVWDYAKANSLTIVSKDTDFRDKVVLESFPPKVIWLRIGNSTTMVAATKLRTARLAIEEFLQDKVMGVLELR